MSGSQIGGIVGGAIGFVASGFNPMGAQVGYAIGSAIGGYVDPVQVKGPQLTDAAQQTSSVGIPLPFGYGTFSTAGNVIWADELKEHVKRQRQGKGGGTKTTTYTYTRSYAIGVCEGPIYGYLIVKRNGKTVYNSDPAAPVADKDYSTKWLQRATLYYGDEVQLPDSTIEAVEGAGNVSAFRGLAYIVIENEDLTDLAGAVPQYEFIVNATAPDIFATTPPYRISVSESLSLAPRLMPDGKYPPAILDLATVTVDSFPDGSLRDTLQQYTIPTEFASVYVASMPNGTLKDVIVQYSNWPPEIVSASISSMPDGELKDTVIFYNNWPTEIATVSINQFPEGSIT